VDGLVVWSVAIVAIGGFVTLLWQVVRLTGRALRRVDDLLEDWQGAPARPGVPARPGMVERITSIEDRVGRVDERLEFVETQLRPNGGSSVRDALDRVDRRTARLTQDGEGGEGGDLGPGNGR